MKCYTPHGGVCDCKDVCASKPGCWRDKPFVDDVDPKARDAGDLPEAATEPTVIEIVLTVAEQRKLVESESGEPCFRMWLSAQEFERSKFADWTHSELSDGRIAVWRKESELDKLQAGGEILMWRAIRERRIDDDVV